GVVVCQINAADIVSAELQQEFTNIGITGGRFFVVDINGQLIYHSKMSTLSKYSLYSVVKENKREDLYSIVDTVVRNTKGRVRIPSFQELPGPASPSPGDHTWYIYATPRNEVMWTFIGAFEEREVYDSLYHRLSWMAIEFTFFVLGFCLFVTLLVCRASKPVEAMTQVAEQVANGDLSVRVPSAYEKRSGSTGRLVRRFNEMIARLNEQKDETIQETAKRVGFEQELSISQDLQQSFLPANRVLLDPPRGYSLCGDLIPAKYVAGDFFDFWRINSQTIGFVVADVSGKGVPAAMVMIAMNTLLRQIASKSTTPGDVVTEVNRILMLRNKKNMFATLFLAYYYPQTGRIVYCNAGHNPPLIACADGSIKSFGYAENMIIGVVPDMKFVSAEMVLSPGELLLVYTDGVTDATNHDGVQFGLNRLKTLLKQSVSLPFKQMFPTMIKTLKDFQSDSQTDDTTMFALKRTEDTSKICTIDETLMTFFGQNENVVNAVLDAMKDKNWDTDDIHSFYEVLEESLAYCDWCNQGELCRQIHLTCSVSETLISMTLGNEGNGWHKCRGSEPDSEKEAELRAMEILEKNSVFMTSVWFNHAGTKILMEKYR
ncbi:MAG: SpoIIE family protein phosphatase, partial [Thermoguttaceae bacterium]|nr:SpoIIE family protein phosphatase [Thermoguttaceae bacterium]